MRIYLKRCARTHNFLTLILNQGVPLPLLPDPERTLLLARTNEDWVLHRYVDRLDIWATVTPVVLPGSDEGKFAKAEKLFFKALGHAGYSPDALAEPEFHNVSFWPGGDLALQLQRPDYLKEAYWSVYHVRLRWKHPFQGPIALGAGRLVGWEYSHA